MSLPTENTKVHSNKAPGNSNLHTSRTDKADEFYTGIELIEEELCHYREHFFGKSVLYNCDDPRVSNFFRYFVIHFKELGLKRLVATCYKSDNTDLFSAQEGKTAEYAVYLEYDASVDIGELSCGTDGRSELDFSKLSCRNLKGNGDFKSEECIRFLKESDIVVTNPPFSLFREYISLLLKYEKKFLILGNINNITYKEIFPSFMQNKIWLGYKYGHFWFRVPDYYEEKATDFKIVDGIKYRRLGNICWYTNLKIEKQVKCHETGVLYDSEKYPKYDNFDAIEVSHTAKIPMDYDGVMGVPITFMSKHNPEQFELLGVIDKMISGNLKVNGKNVYTRIAIRKKEIKDNAK